jgi:hypothetical protein
MVPADSHMLLPVSTLPQKDSAAADEMTTAETMQSRARYRYGIMEILLSDLRVMSSCI